MRFLGPRRGLGYTSQMAGSGSVTFAFPGDTEEALALTLAVERHCRNQPCNELGMSASPDGDHCLTTSNPTAATDSYHRCAAHAMLLEEKTVGRLIFFRRQAERLFFGEFGARL